MLLNLFLFCTRSSSVCHHIHCISPFSLASFRNAYRNPYRIGRKRTFFTIEKNNLKQNAIFQLWFSFSLYNIGFFSHLFPTVMYIIFYKIEYCDFLLSMNSTSDAFHFIYQFFFKRVSFNEICMLLIYIVMIYR